MVGISPCFVCRGQKWMVYQPILSVMEIIVDISSGFCLSWTKNWYINQFCLSQTILVVMSSGFVCLDNKSWYINRVCLSWTLMVCISPSFICHGQCWLVYLPVTSVVNNIGWYICLSWTIMVGLSTDFVFHGQYWLVYHPVLSVVDNIGWYINWFCLSRK